MQVNELFNNLEWVCMCVAIRLQSENVEICHELVTLLPHSLLDSIAVTSTTSIFGLIFPQY